MIKEDACFKRKNIFIFRNSNYEENCVIKYLIIIPFTTKNIMAVDTLEKYPYYPQFIKIKK